MIEELERKMEIMQQENESHLKQMVGTVFDVYFYMFGKLFEITTTALKISRINLLLLRFFLFVVVLIGQFGCVYMHITPKPVSCDIVPPRLSKPG